MSTLPAADSIAVCVCVCQCMCMTCAERSCNMIPPVMAWALGCADATAAGTTGQACSCTRERVRMLFYQARTTVGGAGPAHRSFGQPASCSGTQWRQPVYANAGWCRARRLTDAAGGRGEQVV